MSEAGCPFCNYQGPSDVLHDWGDTFAIEPIDPVTEGHVLIIPKAHVVNFTSSPPTTALTMQRASEWAAVKTGDCNLITSDGPAATQTVPHLHVHVVPRQPDDGLALPWDAAPIEWLRKERRMLEDMHVRNDLTRVGESLRNFLVIGSQRFPNLLGDKVVFGEGDSAKACERCDNTGWLCTECKEPRGKCTCGLDGASENGCPDCDRR